MLMLMTLMMLMMPMMLMLPMAAMLMLMVTMLKTVTMMLMMTISNIHILYTLVQVSYDTYLRVVEKAKRDRTMPR